MFSALRRLGRKQPEERVFPSGVAPVDQSMQKKYSKGVQYNMKIIIKGDRNTGKSTLLNRLSGGPFKEEYIPTHEIQVTNVNWSYRGAEDVIKVEVWDIVDKSKKKRHPSDSLKLTNDDEATTIEGPTEGLALDAQLIDVYKGTHGVILMLDITKAWTWQYVQRELDLVPPHIPVLVLANFRDMGDHKVVDADEISAFVEHYQRPSGSAEIYFSESSMKNAFGLCFIYKFFNMPFLILQRETLLRQLEANALEIEDTREALMVDTSSGEQNYDLFKEILLQKVTPSNKVELSSPEDESKGDINEEEVDAPPVSVAKQLPVATVSPIVQQPPVAKEEPVSKEEPVVKQSRFQAYKAKLFGNSDVKKEEEDEEEEVEITEVVSDVDEFNPGNLENDFLNDVKETSRERIVSDSLSEGDGNPLVANYEDLDSSDHFEDDSADEFDDLSEDERSKVKEKEESSIVQKIKMEKKVEKERKKTVKDTDSLVNTDNIGIPIDNGNFTDNKLDISSLKVCDTETVKASNIEDDVYEDPSFKDEENGHEVSNIQKDVHDSNIDENVPYEVSNIEEDVNYEVTNVEEDVHYEVSNIEEEDWVKEEEENDKETPKEKSSTFDVDDLEMFMQMQMQPNQVENDSSVESEQPVKVKKKKKAKTSEGTENTEKVKRKKKKTGEVTKKSSEDRGEVKKKSSKEGEKRKKKKSTPVDPLESFYAS